MSLSYTISMDPDLQAEAVVNNGGTYNLSSRFMGGSLRADLITPAVLIGTGYMVGVKNIAKHRSLSKIGGLAVLLDDARLDSADYIKGYQIGLWYDTQDNTWYLDWVQHFGFADVAVEAARLRGEVAIWSLDLSQEIRVNNCWHAEDDHSKAEDHGITYCIGCHDYCACFVTK